ncbi:dynamin family protein [Streptomyces caatingaensis]|uniref:dynamin family protein n=1 Tax=Streptomyces caatingaensis TaxID=1678637 RepID=UPI000AFEBD18|nr:dynamin family protein [Streptomyces caatingaensis]
MGDRRTHPGDAAVVAEALTDTAEHLDFVRGSIDGLGPAPERAAAVGAALAQVHRRLADDRPHLAVIGEFSSGKSTFVNGLLRMPLLPADVLPTTAAPVVIEYGPTPLLRVRLDGDPRRYTVRSDGGGTRKRLTAALRERCPDDEIPGEFRPLLALLTAGPRIAPLVSELRVEVPAAALADGLVVVDTPGANGQAEHDGTVRRVMAETADSAVVLTSALVPVPLSLTAFLEDALDRAMLTRCVFLATYADRVPDAERPDVVRAIRARLRARLALPGAAVEAVSAEAVVRGAAGEPLSPEQAAWARRFAETESRLRETLGRQRAVAVGDSTLRLLDRAMRLVREETDARRAELDAEESALAAARIPDLAGFLEPYRSLGLRQLAQADARVRAGIGRTYEEALARTADDCAGLVESAGTVAVLRTAVEEGVTARLRDGLRQWDEAQRRVVRDAFTHAALTAGREVAAAFRTEYARLGEALGRPPDVREPAPPPWAPAADGAGPLVPRGGGGAAGAELGPVGPVRRVGGRHRGGRDRGRPGGRRCGGARRPGPRCPEARAPEGGARHPRPRHGPGRLRGGARRPRRRGARPAAVRRNRLRRLPGRLPHGLPGRDLRYRRPAARTARRAGGAARGADARPRRGGPAPLRHRAPAGPARRTVKHRLPAHHPDRTGRPPCPTPAKTPHSPSKPASPRPKRSHATTDCTACSPSWRA